MKATNVTVLRPWLNLAETNNWALGDTMLKQKLKSIAIKGSLLAILAGAGCTHSGSAHLNKEPIGTLVPKFAEFNLVATASLGTDKIAAALQQFEEGTWTLRMGGAPTCGVDIYHYEYTTKGSKGEPVTASSALMVPRGAKGTCSGARPIILGLHGTMPDRSYNLADVSGQNPASARALLWAGLYASQGYIVVAPNYMGLDSSNSAHQGYHDARQQTGDVIDALLTARKILPHVGSSDSKGLFLAGYSQGGWLAMATHREMEVRGMQVTASMPMSGAYAMTAFVDRIFMGYPVKGSTIYLPLAVRSWQEAYGDLYSDPSEIFAKPWSPDIATLLPSTIPIAKLVEQQKLPLASVFRPPSSSKITTTSAWVAKTMANAAPWEPNSRLAPVYALGFGEDALLTDQIRQLYLADVEAHPDDSGILGAVGEPPLSSSLGLRRAAIKNDLRGWTPKSPLTMCGGPGDGAALFEYGGKLMQRYWQEGPRKVRPGIVNLLDIEAPVEAGDKFAVIKQAFSRELPHYEATLNFPANVDVYHQVVLPRYCYLAARMMFDSYR